MFPTSVDYSPPAQIEHHLELMQNSAVRVGALSYFIDRKQKMTDNDLEMKSDVIETFVRYSSNPDGIPALHYAIKINDKRAVKLLLEYGADPNAISDKQEHGFIVPLFPLDYAALTGDVETIQILINFGANVNPLKIGETWNTWGKSEIFRNYRPLFFAVSVGNEEAVQVLLANGAGVEFSAYEREHNMDGCPFQAAVTCKNDRIFKALLDNCSCVLSLVSESPYVLHLAASAGFTEIVQFLLDQGAYVDTHQGDYTPLMLAKGACVDLLLSRGANPKAKTNNGLDAFWFAACRCDIQATQALLQYRVDMDVNGVRINGYPRTLFQIACEQSSYIPYINALEYLHLLLDCGADINIRCNNATALSIAKSHNNKDLVAWLIQHGARE